MFTSKNYTCDVVSQEKLIDTNSPGVRSGKGKRQFCFQQELTEEQLHKRKYKVRKIKRTCISYKKKAPL